MEKLEAVILLIVVLAGIAGLYYYFSASAGQATRMLKGCEGDYTLLLRLGGAKEGAEYQFRGINGYVELVDIEDGKARLLLDGQDTGYLGFQEIFLGKQAGIKMSTVDRNTAAFCMASTVPECVEYKWVAEETPEGDITGGRVCVRYISSAEFKFEQGGLNRAFG